MADRIKGKDFWGPPTWTTIHILANRRQAYKDFLWLLTELLSCDYCKSNLGKKLVRHPPDGYLGSAEQAFLYSYIIHDLANQHISRVQNNLKVSPPFDDVRGFYQRGLRDGSKFWGPPIWTTVHTLAVTLRSENAEAYKKFLILLTSLLPDDKSQKSLREILEEYPIDPYLRNNHDAFFYSYMIHDLVNRNLGKQSPPYEDVKSLYFSALGEECNDCKI